MFLSLRRQIKICDLKNETMAVIEGEVQAKTPLRLPKSGTPCVYYEMLTESYKTGARGKGRPMWLPDRFDRVCSGFFLSDDTGKVWIEGDADSMSVSGGHEESGVLDKKGRKRYSARFIREGERVRVRGVVSQKGNMPAKCSAVIVPGQKGGMELLVRNKK